MPHMSERLQHCSLLEESSEHNPLEDEEVWVPHLLQAVLWQPQSPSPWCTFWREALCVQPVRLQMQTKKFTYQTSPHPLLTEDVQVQVLWKAVQPECWLAGSSSITYRQLQVQLHALWLLYKYVKSLQDPPASTYWREISQMWRVRQVVYTKEQPDHAHGCPYWWTILQMWFVWENIYKEQ